MHQVGVCSWSLQPTGPDDLVARVRACGLSAVQLALDPIRTGDWADEHTAAALADAGIAILSGMIGTRGEDYSTLESIRRTGGLRPIEHWDHNLTAAKESAALAEELGIGLVTFHAGFLPHDAHDPERRTMIDRLRLVASVFAARGVGLALETGQETAETLAGILEELADANIGVNFDPANIVLYGMGEPTVALTRLAPWVKQIHIKDATPTAKPGTWGAEQPVGHGAVQWPEVFRILKEKCPDVNLVIEREAGDQRIEDIRAAAELIRKHTGTEP